MDSTYYLPYINLTDIYYTINDYDLALKYVNQIITMYPDIIKSYYYRGTIFLNRGDYASAKRDFEKLLSLDPKGDYGKYAVEKLNLLKNLGY